MECDILDSLEQLGYDGPLLEEKALLRASEGGLFSLEYVDLCRWLASRLKSLCELGESITYVPVFLSSELQAAQIVKSRQVSDKQQDESLGCQQLLLICETLKLPGPRGQSAAQLFFQVQNKVEEVLKDLPNGSAGNPVLKKSLSNEQWEKLQTINTVLASEYECRRRMLIKRLDVTVQSFGWSDRAKVKVDSMARAYQPKRHTLRPQPTVDMADLLAAREEICNVVKTSSGASREKSACAVNKILMGRVPDRGGRPSEIEAPPPEMPPWQKRQDGGGGRGGWGQEWVGGRGGQGGRGGWRGGGWNQGGHSGQGGYGGHGGKRGRYKY
ncbi:protein FAM98B isoform X3 [Channa argus]|uniref:protein FAM98B isoform X3 n=1 Tax=Channa argus TaxID=215402 RepID=UPI00352169D2